MGLFAALFGCQKASGPYKDDAINEIYQLLFAEPVHFKTKIEDKNQYPFSIIFKDTFDKDKLLGIINDNSLDSRTKILTYHKLRENGEEITKKIILGIIIEVGLNEGLDVLAVYEDKSARYINNTGKMIIWEGVNDDSISDKIEELFIKGQKVVDEIGPWDKERLKPPKRGNLRLSFLASDGLYFGEGPIDNLAKDEIGGPVFEIGTEIMNLIINETLKEQQINKE